MMIHTIVWIASKKTQGNSSQNFINFFILKFFNREAKVLFSHSIKKPNMVL